MRIATVVFAPIDDSGVMRKIERQAHTWTLEGHEVKLFMLALNDTHLSSNNRFLMEVLYMQRKHTLKFFLSVDRLVRRIISWNPDLVYVRFGLYYPSQEYVMHRFPTIIELNTDDIVEFRQLLSPHVYLYHRMTRGQSLKKCAGLVTVTHEIAQRTESFQKKRMVIGNDIDLSNYPHFSSQQEHTPHPRIVFIASRNRPWHGIDKIMLLARQCPSWNFDIIGLNVSDIDESIPSNVLFHGLLAVKEYQSIMSQADVGIGTLALHRKGMHEASPLKVREYLAYGMPTIIGYQDTDFPQPVSYLLQLPNTEDNVATHVQDIQQFVDSSRNTRVPREEILHLDTRYKEQKRLEFFKVVSEEWYHSRNTYKR